MVLLFHHGLTDCKDSYSHISFIMDKENCDHVSTANPNKLHKSATRQFGQVSAEKHFILLVTKNPIIACKHYLTSKILLWEFEIF